ncbi:MAG: hypothetical protein GWP12_01215 [Nitrospirae bacterium]|nr:hypothetical protein [Nitrospirota bacterium]
MDKPRTIAIGLNFPFFVEYANIAGINGKTHGDATLTIPAMKAVIGVTIGISMIIPAAP